MFYRRFLGLSLCALVVAASAQVGLLRVVDGLDVAIVPDSTQTEEPVLPGEIAPEKSDSTQTEVPVLPGEIAPEKSDSTQTEVPVLPGEGDPEKSDSTQTEEPVLPGEGDPEKSDSTQTEVPVLPGEGDPEKGDSTHIDVPGIEDPDAPDTTIVVGPSDFELLLAEIDSMSIPLVNITLADSLTLADLNADEYIPAEIEIADFYRRTQKDTAVFVSKCKVRYRGATSLAYEKKSFAIKLLDDDGGSRDVKVLGIRKDNNWILNAQSVDRLRMRNKICFDVWNSYSHTPYDTDYDNRNGIECHSVEVFLNGRYHGLYSLSDKVDRKLLALKKVKEVVQQIAPADSLDVARDTTVVSIRGLLYKCTKMGWGGTLMWNNTEGIPPMDTVVWNSFELKHPEEYPSADTWMPLYDLIQLYHNVSSRYRYQQYFDDYYYRQNTLDYMILMTLFRLSDNAMKNTYLSVVDVEKAHQFLITPWDMDASLGATWNGGYLNTVSSFANVATWCAPFNRMYLDATYRSDLEARLAEVFPSSFALDTVRNRMMAEVDLLQNSGAWQRERDRWNGNPVPLKENLSEEVDVAMDWYRSNLIELGLMEAEPEPEPEKPTILPRTAIQEPSCGLLRSLAGYVVGAPSARGLYVRNGKLVRIK